MASIDNVVHDLNNDLFPNGDHTLEVEYSHDNVWYLCISRKNFNQTARVELIIDVDHNNPEDTGVIASVLRHGGVTRTTMALIMDSLLARL